MEEPKAVADKIIGNVERVIIGKREEVRLAVIGLLCQGHILIEDVPGVGKTMLARSLARSTGCTFRRIQFTPDLLPTDVTGVSIYNQKTGEFEFRPGPVLGQLVLADEINRASPRTQSALLEAMAERQLTVDGVTHSLPQPFMVMATQNPIEYEGTFPLPEAQLDRFLLRIHLGYPSGADEMVIMERQQFRHPIEELEPVTTPAEILQVQEAIKAVYVDTLIREYIVAVVEATRSHEQVYLGASPRGSLALHRACQAQALLAGRDYVLPDDVKSLGYPALGHRIIVNPTARMGDVSSASVVKDCLERVAVPGARPRGAQR